MVLPDAAIQRENCIPEAERNRGNKGALICSPIVTYSVGLRTCCADRKTHRLESKIPSAEADLEWIFARNMKVLNRLPPIKK